MAMGDGVSGEGRESGRRLRARFKLWLELDGRPVLGEGGFALLCAIGEEGSIMGACRRLNISYRKALNYIKKIEERLGVTVVETWRGGRGGGEARLTEEGKALVEAFRSLEEAVREALEKASGVLELLS